MDCLLNLVAFCLLDPSNVYITGDIDWSLHGQGGTAAYREGRWCQNRWCTGPMGTLKLGVTVELTREWSVDYGFKHTSMIDADDRGEESFFMSATFRPFRRD
jgi:hypothetical protein